MTYLLLILALLIPSPAGAADYAASVLRVIDGDTLELSVEVWPDVAVKSTLRLSGVNTPESRGAVSACEKAAGLAAKKFTEQFVEAGSAQLSVKGKDKYGRVLGSLSVGGSDLAAALLAAKLAVPYAGGQRKPWC